MILPGSSFEPYGIEDKGLKERRSQPEIEVLSGGATNLQLTEQTYK